MQSTAERIRRMIGFWDRAETDRPLFGFRLGSPEPPGRPRRAGRAPAAIRGPLSPGMVDPEDLLADCGRDFEGMASIRQDAIWSASPWPGFPWAEAVAGCVPRSGGAGFTAAPAPDEPVPDPGGWRELYGRLVARLAEAGRGRFAVGQPALSGPADLLAATLGRRGAELVLRGDRRRAADLAREAVEVAASLLRTVLDGPARFAGGWVLGVLHLWAPGPCLWLRDELLPALRQPGPEDLLLEQIDRLAALAPYSLFHLRPSSFGILDPVLELESVRAVGVQLEPGDPPVVDLLPMLQRVQERGRPLAVCGPLDKEDLDVILERLSYRGLYLQVGKGTTAEAAFWSSYILGRSKPEEGRL